eukprot:756638-Amphidinium_carterae.1
MKGCQFQMKGNLGLTSSGSIAPSDRQLFIFFWDSLDKHWRRADGVTELAMGSWWESERGGWEVAIAVSTSSSVTCELTSVYACISRTHWGDRCGA